MKLVSAIVGVIILIYLSIKHHRKDLFDDHEETPGSHKNAYEDN